MSRERVLNVEFGFKLPAVSQVHIVFPFFPPFSFRSGWADALSSSVFHLQSISLYSGEDHWLYRYWSACSISKFSNYVPQNSPSPVAWHVRDGEYIEVTNVQRKSDRHRLSNARDPNGRPATGLHLGWQFDAGNGWRTSSSPSPNHSLILFFSCARPHKKRTTALQIDKAIGGRLATTSSACLCRARYLTKINRF